MLVVAGDELLSVLLFVGGGNPNGDNTPGRTKEISFVEFSSQLVASGQVEKIVVANNSRVLVYMGTSQDSESTGELWYHFTIGSIIILSKSSARACKLGKLIVPF